MTIGQRRSPADFSATGPTAARGIVLVVVLSAGAIGSPQLLLLSWVGPRDELAQVGIECRLDLPDVVKHLRDHLHTPMFFEAPGIGLNMTEVAIPLGPDALRAPAGPLPADPADDAGLPPELAGLKAEAERRLSEWITTGRSLVSSSLYDAALWYSTGLGDGPKSSVDRPMVASPSSAPKPLQPAR